MSYVIVLVLKNTQCSAWHSGTAEMLVLRCNADNTWSLQTCDRSVTDKYLIAL